MAFRIPEKNPIEGQSLNVLRQTGTLPSVLFTAVKRSDGRTVIPRGRDTVHAGDEVFAIGSAEAIEQLMQLFGVVPQRLNRVIVAGSGRIGIYLAEALEERGVQVSVIDPSMRRAEVASAKLRRSRVLCGDYLDEEVLQEAGVEEADGFVSVTGEDETDILACVAAKQLGARRVLSLVQKPRNLPLLASIPTIDGAVSRHLTAVSHILRLVRRGKIVSVASLHEIQAEVLELLAGERFPNYAKADQGGEVPSRRPHRRHRPGRSNPSSLRLRSGAPRRSSGCLLYAGGHPGRRTTVRLPREVVMQVRLVL
ncbi:MAG: hypothetical protein KatS3mg115_1908 [Candidatus Poribacteria bacterium]|nr:MAG: hypothetical protein KatS3mg115_1908 [Candidatus Poribacteria bacterium]